MQKESRTGVKRNLVGPAHIEEHRRRHLMQRRQRGTNYSVTPDKLNIVEIQRRINKKNLKKIPKHKHCDKLHDLEKQRKEVLVNEKTKKNKQKEDEDQSFPFQPELALKSKNIMVEKDSHLNRHYEWMQKREDKLLIKQEEIEGNQMQLEEEAKIRPDYRKKTYYVDSKVKQQVENHIKTGRLKRNLSANYRKTSKSPIRKR